MTIPSSIPRVVLAVRQFVLSAPDPARMMRSMLAFGLPVVLAPAKGAPTPSSTSSTMAPAGLRKRRRSLVLGNDMLVLTNTGATASRDWDAG